MGTRSYIGILREGGKGEGWLAGQGAAKEGAIPGIYNLARLIESEE